MTLLAKYRRPLVAVIAGCTVSLVIYLNLSAQNAVPLSVPISLAPGRFESPKFRPRASQGYVIAVSFDSSIPDDELECLIGMGPLSSKPCSGQANVLDVSWRVLSHGESVASGPSTQLRGVASGKRAGEVETNFGSFLAEAGREYVVELSVLKDGSSLARANPTLWVEPEMSGDFDPSLFFEGLVMLLGVVSALAGLLIILVKIISSKRKNPALTSP
jgi:hypothetical protein